MRTLNHWSHGHVWTSDPFHWDQLKTWTVNVLKTSWLLLLLVVLGAMSLVTAVLVAWPAVAHIAAKFFN